MDYQGLIVKIVPKDSKEPYLKIKSGKDGKIEKIINISSFSSTYYSLSDYFFTLEVDSINSDYRLIVDNKEINLLDLAFLMSNHTDVEIHNEYELVASYLSMTNINSAFLSLNITGLDKKVKMTYTLIKD